MTRAVRRPWVLLAVIVLAMVGVHVDSAAPRGGHNPAEEIGRSALGAGPGTGGSGEAAAVWASRASLDRSSAHDRDTRRMPLLLFALGGAAAAAAAARYTGGRRRGPGSVLRRARCAPRRAPPAGCLA